MGTILAITPAGHVIVRARDDDVVPEGTPVVEPRGRLHGRVVRVFGPVARPYLSVRPRRSLSPAEGIAAIGSTVRTE